jgi:hypothetical protein
MAGTLIKLLPEIVIHVQQEKENSGSGLGDLQLRIGLADQAGADHAPLLVQEHLSSEGGGTRGARRHPDDVHQDRRTKRRSFETSLTVNGNDAA